MNRQRKAITSTLEYFGNANEFEDTMKKGYITIARFTSNTEPRRGVTIWVEDENYRRVLEIELTILGFGESISGLGAVECKFKILGK